METGYAAQGKGLGRSIPSLEEEEGGKGKEERRGGKGREGSDRKGKKEVEKEWKGNGEGRESIPYPTHTIVYSDDFKTVFFLRSQKSLNQIIKMVSREELRFIIK